VRHRSGGVGDDERVARVGLRVAGIEIRGPSHREAWQVGDLHAHRSRDGDRQRADRVGLVDDHQHPTVLGQPREQVLELGLVLRQGLVEHLLAGDVEGAGVVGLFAHVEPAPDVEAELVVHDGHHPSIETTVVEVVMRQLPAPTLRRDLC